MKQNKTTSMKYIVLFFSILVTGNASTHAMTHPIQVEAIHDQKPKKLEYRGGLAILDNILETRPVVVYLMGETFMLAKKVQDNLVQRKELATVESDETSFMQDQKATLWQRTQMFLSILDNYKDVIVPIVKQILPESKHVIPFFRREKGTIVECFGAITSLQELTEFTEELLTIFTDLMSPTNIPKAYSAYVKYCQKKAEQPRA